MSSKVEVLLSAVPNWLTTLEVVKDELRITNSNDDAWLSRQIAIASAQICQYLGRQIAEETVKETWRGNDRAQGYPWTNLGMICPITLSRWPLVSITSIVEDGNALTLSDYLAENALVYRMNGTERGPWLGKSVEITYVAGWKIPADENRTLPYDVEDVAISLVRDAYGSRGASGNVQWEKVEGVGEIRYFEGAKTMGLTDQLKETLNAYKSFGFGGI